MSRLRRTCAAFALVSAAALTSAGCSNPDAPRDRSSAEEQSAISSPGEPQSPPPPPASSYTAANAKRSPAEALASFAAIYVNWSYRNLVNNQRALAAMSVGAARTAELQAAARSAADTTITSARIANQGSVVSISSEQREPGTWVVVTRERTSGTGDYEGLPAAYHVTLARVTRLTHGYAVSEWLPQS
jgi:hypothetical protein